MRGVVDVGLAAPRSPRLGPARDGVHADGAERGLRCDERQQPDPEHHRDQLRDVVAGRLTTWARFPGSRLKDPIAVFAEPEFEGAQTVFDDTFLTPDIPRVYQPRFVPSSAYMRRVISETGPALGWLDIAHTRGPERPDRRRRALHAAVGRGRDVPGAARPELRHPRRADGRGRQVHQLGAHEPRSAQGDPNALSRRSPGRRSRGIAAAERQRATRGYGLCCQNHAP